MPRSTPPTQARFKEAIAQISSGSAKLDRILADFAPLARDLGSPANTTPTTSVGQAITRLNRVVFELSLLSGALVDPTDPKGRRLNTNGSLQKLLTTSELHDNLNGFASSGRDVFSQAGRMIRNLTEFSEKIARDPAVLSSGALRPR